MRCSAKRTHMNSTRLPSGPTALAFLLAASVWLCPPQESQAAVLQSFERLFQGDDPSESFQFSLEYDPAGPTTVRFAGFVENLSAFDETGARFLLGWGAHQRQSGGGRQLARRTRVSAGGAIPAGRPGAGTRACAGGVSREGRVCARIA